MPHFCHPHIYSGRFRLYGYRSTNATETDFNGFDHLMDKGVPIDADGEAGGIEQMLPICGHALEELSLHSTVYDAD